MSDLLRLAGVGKCHRRGAAHARTVLRDASLTVAAGEIVVVDGERRAGKTTLLRVAAGLELPDTGRVCFQGSDMAMLSSRQRAQLLGREIAWADRRGPRVPWRVLDYVSLPLAVAGRGAAAAQRQARGAGAMHRMLGRRPMRLWRGGRSRSVVEARERGLAALERVGAARCATQRWEDLADWEQVLVSLARVYAQRPSLIVADDLFDDLRGRGTQQAGDLLRSIVAELDCGVLASVSDSEAALLGDRVLALRGGTLLLRSDQSAARQGGALLAFPERRSMAGH